MIAMFTTLLMFYVSQNNIISLLIAIEILLLTVTVKIIYLGGQFDDVQSTMFALFIITLAGAESAIGLSLLVSYYRLRGKVTNIL
ncbi:NADH dehydrogenase subunit 4L (mitochondrion) [Debaryomyces hansenii]|uniref:NADH-ubiquinone oxidoreductase chain 4L n=1 Tax=Debaryomyces hansenii (strain ATCC 36239 / CBS 767 / BCRC 21394 / JCM 1990 / NBRC 0083 / IGC 2968) TaxID=284592 RepID=NU4LM_DEBHA|nr:NADH dehydrogenase subunit 4L [Debaryomyces hansenii]A9RAH1.1 RecName: Full=NADH-ubiquinone oxidoreductase chain 4L; AltName: Full=NADH dehydrogenase subunit 4L [Debaryomyces hansenii CBS767]ABF58072.1 NADH dehydrogenase subunit 4L [Debaryomyces hansenii]|eukprot:YP_001621423.1 NADH dehydrogenase subunit 4L (mitochondrion) [Debaryomyces hansenii]